MCPSLTCCVISGRRAAALHGSFELKEHTFGVCPEPVSLCLAESRVTWKLFVPHRGRLQMFVAFGEPSAASVAVRVGVTITVSITR